MRKPVLIAILVGAFGCMPMFVGCDKTLSSREKTTQGPNGETTHTQEKTVEHPNGSVSTEKQTSHANPNQ